ncbi:MAG: hypothetical protein ETSY1_27530 [Candidatus Entotheonella factor]|uniref:CopG family transcriptional regulator n=1 Tax=Entotheonella factor TaxID=1429438 RepID=W4LE01_ENTF1|nr:hypothetical protein [Candidatus Entotheonella palauensis]ETW96222.1 MAG: hypothetical protein ETSY1_27530 [Candidatus Entotheonella factor]
MRPEYDFSQGERGKFYQPDAQFYLPVYLEEEVLNYLRERAQSKGVDLNDFVNDILKKDIALIESVK